jgi:hypothetical protein
MRASHLARLPRRLLALTLAAGVLLALALFTSPAFAAAGFGIEPGSFIAGTFTEVGATGALGEGATPDEQAGDHPYEQTVSFTLNGNGTAPDGDTKDVVVELPPGFVGDPNATPRCQPAVLTQTSTCPADTVIGVAGVTLYIGGVDQPIFMSVYNMVPSSGQLALFAFHTSQPSLSFAIHIGVRNASDYGLTATVSDISQVGVPLASTVTLWGVPADPSHDPYRGVFPNGCMEESAGTSRGSCPSDAPVRPLLRNPTACDASPLTTTLSVVSWEEPASPPPPVTATQPALSGCEKLVFDPSLEVTPETSQVDTPTGVQVDLHVPQNEDPYGLATPDLRNATVTLPAGMAISPSVANGLEGCTPEEIGLHSENPVACPNASKLGTVRVTSPDLP